MKRISQITLLVLLAISFSCDDETVVIAEDCIAATLKREKFDRYTGQDMMECKGYLALYTLHEQKFFMYVNPCAGSIFYAFDCAGDPFCEPATTECINYFTEHAVLVGIVGIAKD